MLVSAAAQIPTAARACGAAGFCRRSFKACSAASTGEPVLFVSNPPGMDRDVRAPQSRRAQEAQRTRTRKPIGDPETLTRIGQYELAFRMQMAVPEVMDISQRSRSTSHEAYGAAAGQASFANNCLLGRRLVEQGVRYVQLFDWGWDFHGTGARRPTSSNGLPKKCQQIDRPSRR